jgi:quercetin dioxygenase-like cupin family protein
MNISTADAVRATFILVAVAATLAGALHAAAAQAPGVTRIHLQQHDLSVPGREVVQVRVDIAPGVLAPPHSHPGEEIVYVIEGSIEYRLEGAAPVTLKAGDVLFIPANAVHSAKNVGRDNAAELATYIVEKGKPLAKPFDRSA